MAKARELVIPDAMLAALKIDEDEINRKIQVLVDRRKNQSEDEIINVERLISDYRELFSYEELVGMLFALYVDISWLEGKLSDLAEISKMSEDQFDDFLNKDIDDPDLESLFGDFEFL